MKLYKPNEPIKVIAGGDLYLLYVDVIGDLDKIYMYPDGSASIARKVEFEDLCLVARMEIEQVLISL